MCSHCPHLGVGDESSESCPLLLLMGKKSLKSFKEKCFMPVAFLTSFDRPCPGGYGRGERATLTNASRSALNTVGVMTECCRAPSMLLISQPARILRDRSNRLSLLRVVPTRYSLLRLRMAARFPSLTTPRSKIHTLRAFPYFRSTVRSKHHRSTVPVVGSRHQSR